MVDGRNESAVVKAPLGALEAIDPKADANSGSAAS